MFYSQMKVDGGYVLCTVFLEALPFLRTSCGLVVIIKAETCLPTDAKIIEGLTLTRDQVTASIDIFRMGLIIWFPHFIFLASTA